MMKKTIAVLAVFLGLAAVATAAPTETKAKPDKSKWETLFAGDLSDAAVVDTLVDTAFAALRRCGFPILCVGGGVAANWRCTTLPASS